MQALKDPEAQKWLVKGVGKVVQFEVKKLCSDRVNSLQQSNSEDHIANFPWNKLFFEITENCPTLLSLLLHVTSTKRETKRVRQNNLTVVVVCMLSKFHHLRMSIFQRLISVLLYAGHVGTMVSHACSQFPPSTLLICCCCLICNI